MGIAPDELTPDHSTISRTRRLIDLDKKAGVVAPPRTFGFHTFRRTLASVLVKIEVDPKLVQEMLRHQNLETTLEVYAKAVTEDKLEAQGMFLELLFRGRKVAEPDPVKNLEKTAPVTDLVQ